MSQMGKVAAGVEYPLFAGTFPYCLVKGPGYPLGSHAAQAGPSRTPPLRSLALR